MHRITTVGHEVADCGEWLQNAKAKHLITIAMDAIAQEDFDDVVWLKKIICEGLSINAQSPNGWTMLHQAVLFNKFEIVNWLIENGADQSVKNDADETPWDLYSGEPTSHHLTSKGF